MDAVADLADRFNFGELRVTLIMQLLLPGPVHVWAWQVRDDVWLFHDSFPSLEGLVRPRGTCTLVPS